MHKRTKRFKSSHPQLLNSEPLTVKNNEVIFTINGKVHKEVAEGTSLNTFIREVVGLKGTKVMCAEGGCGACIVSATVEHPVTKVRETKAVNSCLVPVLQCQGWELTTVEGIGDRQKGYHKVQAQLAHFNGTQCGYCSPGMVMNMYSLLEGGKMPTMAEVENSFGGNICRCTGYRPILDAFKSMASDAPPAMKAACADIEDVYKICSKTGQACAGTCKKEQLPANLPTSVAVSLGSAQWRKVGSLAELRSVLAELADVPYKLVAGNTAEGVYRSEGITAYVDIRSVPELRGIVSKSPKFVIGANLTLTEAMELFNGVKEPGYEYMRQLATHIDWIANVPVRNAGTLAGNLSIKKSHNEFPSDIFTTFEAVGAKLNIMDSAGETKAVTLVDYLMIDMNKKFILSIEFPKLSNKHHFRSFKITPRAQNAHAYVNAGFLVKVENTSSWKVVGKPRIVFGGISPNITHASKVQAFLTGKSLLNSATLSSSIAELGRELLPDRVLPDATAEYRKNLAQALFYKFLLGLDPSKVGVTFKSGGENLVRPLSSGKQEFQADESVFPLNQPVPKIEALAQCSGEAQFIDDIPTVPGELHAAFVLTKVANGSIAHINPEDAIALPGVVAFFSHRDMKHYNTFTPKEFSYFHEEEEIFCSGEIKYAGQAIGMVVAETRDLALKAADKVKIEYKKAKNAPVLSIDEALQSGGDRVHPATEQRPQGLFSDVKPTMVIKGEFEVAKQSHFAMEPLICLVVPVEDDSFNVFSTTQWMDQVQTVVAKCLNIKASKVNMSVRRLGGGFGAKITRPSQLAGACAVASQKLNRAVRLVLPLTANMELLGKRYAVKNKYEVGVDAKGKIEYLKTDVVMDSGCNLNDSPFPLVQNLIQNCYSKDNFDIRGAHVLTDTASNTWCRAPGDTEGIAFIEEIMERIAAETKQDPLDVRMANFHNDENAMPELIADLRKSSDYDARQAKAKEFNAVNRWKKRGLALVPMQYPFGFRGNYTVIVSIYQIDGSVAISHGGIEMGQGMNTKVAQVAAHVLGVPLDLISVKPSNNLISPNAINTGASVGSEAVSYATLQCCNELIGRLAPFKEQMKGAPWPALIKAAHGKQVDLTATYMFSGLKDKLKNYIIWGAAAAEVEVDILTGEKQVLRVDLIEDAGISLSPLVDIGQIEGSFVMGMGYWLTEELVYDPVTGRQLNTRTWNYKVPGAKDIPADFRVSFRKNAKNPDGVLNSKATGEPSMCMSIVVLFAITDALNSARRDAGVSDYHQLKPPATAEHIFLAALTDPKDFVL